MILTPFSMFRNALAKAPYLHGHGGYKIITYLIFLGRHMPA